MTEAFPPQDTDPGAPGLHPNDAIRWAVANNEFGTEEQEPSDNTPDETDPAFFDEANYKPVTRQPADGNNWLNRGTPTEAPKASSARRSTDTQVAKDYL